VDRLIAEETIEGDAFRRLVEDWERADARDRGTSAGQAAAEADVEAAQVGV
jgi:cell division protease FtsH